MEKSRAEGTVHSHRGREHDSEDVSRRGMSSDATAADEAETMASTGDSFFPVRFLLFGVFRKEGLPHG